MHLTGIEKLKDQIQNLRNKQEIIKKIRLKNKMRNDFAINRHVRRRVWF